MLTLKSIPIPIEIADVEIKKYTDLKAPGIAILEAQFAGDVEKMNFHGSTHNSFVFEREAVLRFFMDEKDIPPKAPDGKADLLMVVLGAHPGTSALDNLHIQNIDTYKQHEDQFPQGRPTVIVAGVTYNANEPDIDKQISLLDTSLPAVEYPPGRTIAKLLPANHNNQEKKLFFRFIPQ